MFLKFDNTVDTIFLDKDSEAFSLDTKVSVVLSPSLYWVKKVSLPVKYLREVKALLPSLFEEILPEGNYSYYAYKKGAFFYIFAYQDAVILEVLKSKGVSPVLVQRVYFAQSEFDAIDEPLKIAGEKSIYLKDELVLLLPKMGDETHKSLDTKELKLSKNYVTLEQFSHIVNNKTLYTLMGIFMVFITLFALEYFLVYQKVEKTLEVKSELFAKNNLKSTMMQNRSLLKEYKNTHGRQMKFREYMGYLLKLQLDPKQKISLIDLKQETLRVDFIGFTKGSEQNLLKQLKSHGVDVQSTYRADILEMELRL